MYYQCLLLLIQYIQASFDLRMNMRSTLSNLSYYVSYFFIEDSRDTVTQSNTRVQHTKFVPHSLYLRGALSQAVALRDEYSY